MRFILYLNLIILYGCGVAQDTQPTANAIPSRPNIVLIFTDDQGYADLGCYGGDHVQTPALDKLAAEGTRFSQFYVAQAVCSASRAALLTGCYPNRLGIRGAFGPHAPIGLHPQEFTLAELCRAAGYRTGMVAKWHLCDHPSLLPTQQGFDSYFGVPYSHDMWNKHPLAWQRKNFPQNGIPLIRNTTTIDSLIDLADLTERYQQAAIDFIEAQDTSPFFLYLAHSMPHVPLFIKETGAGARPDLYSKVIAEIDQSVAQLRRALARKGFAENTLIIYTSDNGPWLAYGGHAGRATPLREGKGTSFEGGIRVPCIVHWPGVVPAGQLNNSPLRTLDILPSIAALLEEPLPEQVIDGHERLSTLLGRDTSVAPTAYPVYWLDELQAVISADGRWKLHFPHTYRSLDPTIPVRNDGIPVADTYPELPLSLFDLEHDIGEEHDVATEYPAIVANLSAAAARFREGLGDDLQDVEGKDVRPLGLGFPRE